MLLFSFWICRVFSVALLYLLDLYPCLHDTMSLKLYLTLVAVCNINYLILMNTVEMVKSNRLQKHELSNLWSFWLSQEIHKNKLILQTFTCFGFLSNSYTVVLFSLAYCSGFYLQLCRYLFLSLILFWFYYNGFSVSPFFRSNCSGFCLIIYVSGFGFSVSSGLELSHPLQDIVGG